MFNKVVFLVMLTASALYGAEISYERQTEMPSFLALRQRAWDKPRFYAEIQSYRLVENYLHYWMDRPLFHDSSLRAGSSYRDSFLRNVEIVKNYDIDGFTALANAPSLNLMYTQHLQALKEVPPYPGFSYMCGASYTAKPDATWHEFYLKNYEMALNAPWTLRINGKVPVWGYESRNIKPEQLRDFAKRLEEKTSVAPLLFAELNIADEIKLIRLYEKNGMLTPEQMKQLSKLLEDLLNSCDGLIVKPGIVGRDASEDYSSKSLYGYFQDCYLPVLLELLTQPRFKGKLIGGVIRKGYINHLSGDVYGEFGTGFFRKEMEWLQLLNPDVVVFNEWNESNENTFFQPTVNDSKTMQRLLKFYARKMRGQPPVPDEGDDPSIPNLVFSSRQVLRLGDILRYELLNIPDSDSHSEYRAQLIIRDYNGKALKIFPEETFTVAQMKAVSYEIPSEQLAEHALILPELRVVNTTGEERLFPMQYNRIHPSVCVNYKEIMQPLRDLLPLTADFEAKADKAPNHYRITANAEASEPLAQLEVLDNEDEAFAVDREKRYDIENNIVIWGSFTAFQKSTRKIVFEVRNAPGWKWFRECYRYKTEDPDPQIINNKVTASKYRIDSYYLFPFYITIPKTAAEKAILEIDIAGIGKHTFEVAELLKLGKMARAFDGDNRLDLRIAKNLIDIPVPLQQQKAEFSTLLESENRYPIYQLRAISLSGKIYRSRPVMPVHPSGEMLKHNIFSVAKKGAVTVEVAKACIPELIYQFDDACGAMLKNSWEPRFDGQLGGGFTYLEPFNRPRNLLSIPGRKFLHPVWKDADNVKVLEFDGLANYINLPYEALPYGSFTLEFEIKPAGNDTQVLFRNYSRIRGSLQLYRRDGKLTAMFGHRLRGYYPLFSIETLETGLMLPEGEWSKIMVSYNLKELCFMVNGKTHRIPFNKRGAGIKASVFGGHNIDYELGRDGKFFKGQLRGLRIRHTAEP